MNKRLHNSFLFLRRKKQICAGMETIGQEISFIILLYREVQKYVSDRDM